MEINIGVLDEIFSTSGCGVNERKLGKIKVVKFGLGGYQDMMIGVNFTLGGEGWGVQDFWGNWSHEWTDNCKWTEENRLIELGKVCMKLNFFMTKAGVTSLEQLKDKPIEVEFEMNTLKSWRILTEVI